MLMKLRQAALHPILVKKTASDDDDVEMEDAVASGSGRVSIQEIQAQLAAGNDAFKDKAFGAFLKGEVSECAVCFDEVSPSLHLPLPSSVKADAYSPRTFYLQPEIPAILLCGHGGCKSCLIACIEQDLDQGKDPHCPVCEKPAQLEDIIEARRKPRATIKIVKDEDEEGAEEEEDDNAEPTWAAESSKSNGPVVLLKNDFMSSTKLEALVNHLDRISSEDPKMKALVFSHFTVSRRNQSRTCISLGGRGDL